MDIKNKFENFKASVGDDILEKIVAIKIVGSGKGTVSKEELQAANEKVLLMFDYYTILEQLATCVIKINPCQSSTSEYI